MQVKRPVIVYFIGPSGSGKTTLIEKLIHALRKKGLAVGAIKHAHHGFQMDRPGKDSYRFRAAGASAVAIVSPRETALIFDMQKYRDTIPISKSKSGYVPVFLQFMGRGLDLILVEGFRETKGWRFHVEGGGLSKPLKRGRGYLGTIRRQVANRPTDIARLLIKKFGLR